MALQNFWTWIVDTFLYSFVPKAKLFKAPHISMFNWGEGTGKIITLLLLYKFKYFGPKRFVPFLYFFVPPIKFFIPFSFLLKIIAPKKVYYFNSPIWSKIKLFFQLDTILLIRTRYIVPLLIFFTSPFPPQINFFEGGLIFVKSEWTIFWNIAPQLL